MSYQVLARKWRPDSFAALVGQSHIVRALINALDQQRLHHAYLFTGTRGVGKTTLGRILAKCLNCEKGISSTPCLSCQSCQEIAAGRFIDLIEVDAASRTKVEDMRDLLENVPYAPQGRIKVILIDEVHMLSTHSFNALLKTLEEPPPHLKFFLATTDPQKIPITVLSRCLQFHLKCLSPELISQRMAFILEQEAINYENEALMRIAYAAEGSMRDALSLLDQAIAFSNKEITTTAIKSMLSTIEATYLYEIMEALQHQQAEKLIQITHSLAEQSLDFATALEELLSLLHQIAIAQFVDTEVGAWNKEKINDFAKQFTPEDIQLFYQIALIGRKDLPLAPTPRIGLEMILLRLLAFQPKPNEVDISPSSFKETQTMSELEETIENKKTLSKEKQWHDIITQLNLTGLCGAIASHCIIDQITEDEIVLAIDPQQSVLLNRKYEERISNALQDYYKHPLRLTMKIGEPNMDTPASRGLQILNQRKSFAKQSISQDSNLKKMVETFNAQILPNSIEANDND